MNATVSKSVVVTINHQALGEPDFAITAVPLEVTVGNGISQDPATRVAFTVRSINGFTGQVTITWVTDGGASPQPNDNSFFVNVAPNAPATFERHFYRYTTGNEEIPITFNATDNPFTKTRGVTINVKHP